MKAVPEKLWQSKMSLLLIEVTENIRSVLFPLVFIVQISTSQSFCSQDLFILLKITEGLHWWYSG